MHHKWLFPKNVVEAQASQKEMAEKVIVEDAFAQPIQYIAGVDISNMPFDPAQRVFAAVVVLAYPSLEIVEIATHAGKQEFPYIPGLLGFREIPSLVEAYYKLSIQPDLIMVDGHGISHPRGLGIASHLGLLLNKPTIGVAKSILVGKPSEMLAQEVGSMVALEWKNRELAAIVRTKARCKPLIISAGHKISLQTALQHVFQCLKGYRLPEPTRHAHREANICRKKFLG